MATLAQVIGAFDWALRSLSFKFLLKTDDDSFVCLARLLELLRPLPRAGLYLGYRNKNRRCCELPKHAPSPCLQAMERRIPALALPACKQLVMVLCRCFLFPRSIVTQTRLEQKRSVDAKWEDEAYVRLFGGEVLHSFGDSGAG